MSLHRNDRMLKCHYCNTTAAIPKTCPSCGAEESLGANRLGTAEVAATLQEALPDARIALFDRDAITTANQLKKTLKAFNEGEIDILVGTQMLSKGHNYHRVDLAVILGLDHLLGVADFRSEEKAMGLFLQIAGRAGRKEEGTVLVQTNKEDFFKTHLHDYEGFLKEELRNRRGLYPPFTHLLRLLFAHRKPEKAREAMDAALTVLRSCNEVEVVGFGECAITKIANRHRYHILLRSSSPKALLQAAHTVDSPAVEIDMNPLSFS